MRCPNCESAKTKVKDSRPANDIRIIRRRRYCQDCKSRFTTYETIDSLSPETAARTWGARSLSRFYAALAERYQQKADEKAEYNRQYKLDSLDKGPHSNA